jgi:hypothetical protein
MAYPRFAPPEPAEATHPFRMEPRPDGTRRATA